MFGVKQLFFLVMFNGDRVGCGWWQTGRLLEWLVVSGCAVGEFLALNGLIVGDGWGEPKGCWRWLVVNRRGVCGGGRCMGVLLVVNRRGVLT